MKKVANHHQATKYRAVCAARMSKKRGTNAVLQVHARLVDHPEWRVDAHVQVVARARRAHLHINEFRNK